jgi:hypothetical protein
MVDRTASSGIGGLRVKGIVGPISELCRLADARLLGFAELQGDDQLWVTVRLLPPRPAVSGIS